MKYANLRLLSQLACVVAILDILIITEGAIHRRRSRKDLSLQSGGIIDGPVEEILKEVEGMRPRRAAGEPTFSRSELSDGHLVAQIRYSGQVNSEVKKIIHSPRNRPIVAPCTIANCARFIRTCTCAWG